MEKHLASQNRRSSEVLKKQQDNGKGHQSEELVRYMSNLPSYLKKDVKLNEKALSVGVLDWKLLENWQHFHNIGNQHPSTSSNISPFTSSGGSSSHSSGGHSLSPACQKHPYTTLQSHFYETPFENCSRDTKPSVVNKLKAQDHKDRKAKDSKVPKSSIVRKSQSLENVGEKMKVREEEFGIASSSLNNPKDSSKGRSSSPLRRLLDPLIGPARASLSDSRSSEPASKSSEGHGKSSAHSVKVKLDLKTCKNADAEVPRCSSKSPTVQALLQVAVRNGFPLFTFAVDNKNDILAATMRKSSSEKEEFSSIYSFFVVQEMKKHSGSWINNRRKDKGNSFVHNIVAQMKVTDTLKPNSLKQYVLFSYDTKQAETSALELNDELAAVVVNRGENRTEDQLSLTVILPGGHHGQPLKGEPFSLVERWKSGGSCDCGGWDLGCRMRVLTDNAQFHRKSSSAKPHQTPKLLQLFSQDEHDQKPVFSLAPFKDGIYAVEFNSSIEILQAFSISLSILSCLKPGEFVGTSNGVNKNSSADVTVLETQTEVPAFVSNPPLSPVGRV